MPFCTSIYYTPNPYLKMQTINLKITGMSCGACVGHVSKALQSAPGVSSAVVDLASQSARVEGQNLDVAQLQKAVEEEGYQAHSA